MTTSTKLTLVVLALVVIGGYLYSGSSKSQVLGSVSSPVGTTFSTALVAQKNFSPATGTATSTSLFNSDGLDRYISGAYAACSNVGTSLTAYTGAGLASLLFKAATTSTNAPATVSNTNLPLSLLIATATPDLFIAGTSTGAANSYITIWPSGTYLTIWSNATNTAACTVGVHYIAS